MANAPDAPATLSQTIFAGADSDSPCRFPRNGRLRSSRKSSTNVKMTGMTRRLRNVEVRSPPITTIAIGCRKLPSPPVRLKATGSMPHPMAIVVMMMGRARLWQASTRASNRVMPPRRAMMAYSTSRIEFFVTTPMSMSNPITAGMEKLVPVTMSGRRAPPSDSGSAIRMVRGCRKSWKSRTSTA